MRLFYGWILILLTGITATSGCTRGSSAAKPVGAAESPEEVLAVDVVQLIPHQVVRRVELVGTLEGQQEVSLSSQVSGRVTHIYADLGDRVDRGKALVELDPLEYQLAVNRQVAALGQVLARLGVGAENDPLPDPEATSSVVRAEAEREEARLQHDRSKALYEKGVVSRQVFDLAESRYRVAQANYITAVEEVRNLKAQVLNLRAQLELARKNLSDTRVPAPFAGTVTRRQVEVGQYVRDQTPLLTIASTNPLKLRATVPELWFPHVRAGAAVAIRVDAYPQESFAGTVTRIGLSIDPQSRTFPIEARIDNAAGKLRPGLFARALLETARKDSILLAPARAVISFYGVLKVYGVEDGIIQEKVVKVGDRIGDDLEITEGLAAGSRIATTELSRIRQGTRVRVKEGS